MIFGIVDRAEVFGEAPAGDHGAGKACGLLDVRASTRGDVFLTEADFLCHAAAHQDGQTRGHLDLRHRQFVFFRQLHDHAERTTTRNDRGFVHGVRLGNVHRHNSVTGLMISGELFFLGVHHHGFALRAHHHLVFGVFELTHGDDTLATASGEQCGFVDKVHQVSTRKARRAARDGFRIDVFGKRHLTHVDFQNALAANDIRIRHSDLTVEPAGTQQSRVKHVRTVGRGDDDDTFVGLKAVHLDEQLVQRLLTLVITAAKAGAAMAADRVNLIDEDDARSVLLGLFEHVAHAACADADEHLDKVRTGDREERHIGFARDRTRDQGLTRAGRADEQRTFWNLAAQTLELGRVFQELDDFLQFFLGFINACDVFKGDAAFFLREQAGLGLAKAHRAAASALHVAHQEEPHAQDQNHRQPCADKIPERVLTLSARNDAQVDASFFNPGREVQIKLGRIGNKGAAIPQGACRLIAAKADFRDRPGFDTRHHFRIGNLGRGLRRPTALLDVSEYHHQQERNDTP